MGDGGYQVSEASISAIGMSATILSIISVGACVFFLFAAAWVYSVPEARHTIDRISFRLMIWCMVFGLGYDICYFLAEPRFAIIDPTSVQCKVVMYWQVATMGAVNYFITCVAVNLMLSIHFAFNPLTMRLERWYVGVSLLVALGVPLFPAGLGHFGADPVYDACYFTAPNTNDRLRNFVLDLYLWQAAATIIACVAVTVTLVTLFRSGRATAKALLFKDSSMFDSLDQSIASETSASCAIKSWTTKMGRRRRRKSVTYRLQDQFLNIAIRVAIYPVVLVIMNTILTAGDLYLSATGTITSRAEYGLYIMYYILYGGRNIFLAIVGIFVDPGLPRGMRIAWRILREKTKQHAQKGQADAEDGDMDFASALASVPVVDLHARSRPTRFLSLDGVRAPVRRDSVEQSQSYPGILRNGASPDAADRKDTPRDSTSDRKTLSRPESLVYADPATGEPPAGFLPNVERNHSESALLAEQERARIARREWKQGIVEQNLEMLTHRL